MLSTIKKIWQCFFSWKAVSETSNINEFHVHVQAIVALTFGRAAHGQLGRANQHIAYVVESLMEELNLPYCVEGEIGDCMTFTEIPGYVGRHASDVHHDDYQGTYGIAKQMVDKFLGPQKITKVLLVAHPHHAWRCKQVLQKLGIDVSVTATIPAVYDKESTQPWTRSAWNPFKTGFTRALLRPTPRNIMGHLPFKVYEPLARLYYLKQGWI